MSGGPDTTGAPTGAPSGDEAVAGALRHVLVLADPVPAAWRSVAGAAFAWTALDGVPARLAYDSHLGRDLGDDAARPAGTVPRQLRYASGVVAVELDLDVGPDKVRVSGRVVPGVRVEVVAHWPEGRQATVADGDGGFHFDELPRRPLCVVVAGDLPVKTGWVVV